MKLTGIELNEMKVEKNIKALRKMLEILDSEECDLIYAIRYADIKNEIDLAIKDLEKEKGC